MTIPAQWLEIYSIMVCSVVVIFTVHYMTK